MLLEPVVESRPDKVYTFRVNTLLDESNVFMTLEDRLRPSSASISIARMLVEAVSGVEEEEDLAKGCLVSREAGVGGSIFSSVRSENQHLLHQ